jgi:phosphoglycerate dehydrogenase-like enzyme
MIYSSFQRNDRELNSKYRVAVTRNTFLKRWHAADEIFKILRDKGCEIDFPELPIEVDQDQRRLAKVLEGYDFVIASTSPYYGREFFINNQSVCVIALYAVGYDNIDINAAAEFGVHVIRVPNIIERNSVAEHTIALMLATLRRVPWADKGVRKGRYMVVDYTYELFSELSAPKDLGEMVIGIIGLGNIGSRVAEILIRGFGSRVLAYDPYIEPKRAKALGVELVESLEEIFARSDIVTIHTSLTPETKHMINKNVFSKAKKGIILINTARGAIIDTEALLWAMREGIVSYAGLDVFEVEPLPDNHPLITMDNTILTPHIAASVETTLKRMLESIVKAIANYIDGKPMEEHAIVVVKPDNPRKPKRK